MALTTARHRRHASRDEGDHWIDDWRPEDPVFETIAPIARRISIFHLRRHGFSV